MMGYFTFCLLVLVAMVGVAGAGGPADTADDLLAQAAEALRKQHPEDTIRLAGKVIAGNPKNARAHLLRGAGYEALQQHREAIADFDKALELEPRLAVAYDHRGSERLKLGLIKEAISDFDRYLELEPKQVPGHWKRGIAYYYAGRYEDGAKQFASYEKVDTNDVENAVWRYLCMARVVGVEKARAAMLKVGKDARVPMMEIYALFLDKAKPDDVLAAARAGSPAAEQLTERLFYAELYLGLYFDSLGKKTEALEHLTEAVVKHKIGHYMWDVGRVHLDTLRRQAR
jgi:lipoprotein NlpI